jgi:hypothetical protein
MKTLNWSGVSNTSKIPWYLANYDIKNRVFYMLDKHLLKNTFVSKLLKYFISKHP